MILPATLSTVNALFRGRERAIAFAIWGSTIGGMAAVGPFLGGLLTTDLSWRWAFLINIPLGIAILVGLLTVIPETSDPDTPRGLDVPGQLTLILGLSALVFGLIQGQTYGWWRTTEQLDLFSWPRGAISPVPIVFAVSVVSMVAFVIIERARIRAGRLVVVDLRLFAIKSFSRGNVAALIVALGEFGILFVLPLYLQGALGLSALDTGAALIPLADRHSPCRRPDDPAGAAARAARGGPVGPGAGGAGHRRARAHPGRATSVVGDSSLAVRLRGRRRVRNGAAHRRDPHRRSRRGQRPGLWVSRAPFARSARHWASRSWGRS